MPFCLFLFIIEYPDIWKKLAAAFVPSKKIRDPFPEGIGCGFLMYNF